MLKDLGSSFITKAKTSAFDVYRIHFTVSIERMRQREKNEKNIAIVILYNLSLHEIFQKFQRHFKVLI